MPKQWTVEEIRAAKAEMATALEELLAAKNVRCVVGYGLAKVDGEHALGLLLQPDDNSKKNRKKIATALNEVMKELSQKNPEHPLVTVKKDIHITGIGRFQLDS